MHIVADLQLHSRFSRAVSKQMTLPNMVGWARRKGIGLLATGDWTHPMWFREISQQLEEIGNGLLKLKSGLTPTDVPVFPKDVPDPLFLLATEVSCIYSQGGKARRVHTLIWVPSFASAAKINQELTRRGCNLLSDGRPIIGLTSIQVAELVFEIEPNALIIPAHAWTPWFALYGSMSGFDSISEAFGPYADRIFAVETGLSSNPSMNWRIAELDNRAIVSFSDAHSGAKLGREATVFEIPQGELSYEAIHTAISRPNDQIKIAYTIEFYPEEGKYHFTGHRTCNIRQTPQETKEKGTSCPVCGKPLTVGVMHRVEALAGRSDLDVGVVELPAALPEVDGKVYGSKTYTKRPPFIMLVPLLEVLSEALGVAVGSVKVQSLYFRLTDSVGTEFDVLLRVPLADISSVAGEKVAKAIERVRKGELHIDPGFDGVFGVVKIWDEGESPLVTDGKEQLTLLS